MITEALVAPKGLKTRCAPDTLVHHSVLVQVVENGSGGDS